MNRITIRPVLALTWLFAITVGLPWSAAVQPRVAYRAEHVAVDPTRPPQPLQAVRKTKALRHAPFPKPLPKAGEILPASAKNGTQMLRTRPDRAANGKPAPSEPRSHSLGATTSADRQREATPNSPLPAATRHRSQAPHARYLPKPGTTWDKPKRTSQSISGRSNVESNAPDAHYPAASREKPRDGSPPNRLGQHASSATVARWDVVPRNPLRSKTPLSARKPKPKSPPAQQDSAEPSSTRSARATFEPPATGERAGQVRIVEPAASSRPSSVENEPAGPTAQLPEPRFGIPTDSVELGPQHRQLLIDEAAATAHQHIEFAAQLVRDGDLVSARAAFVEALRTISIAWDGIYRTQAHVKALDAGLYALSEAEDFVRLPQAEAGQAAVVTVVAEHRTAILRETGNRLTPIEAMHAYFALAQEQLVVASGGQAAASQAICGLARVGLVLCAEERAVQEVGVAKAVSLYQAALAVDSENPVAANELGVLMAQYGELHKAEYWLQHSVRLNPHPVATANLARVSEHLGLPNVEDQVRHASSGQLLPPDPVMNTEEVTGALPSSPHWEIQPAAAAAEVQLPQETRPTRGPQKGLRGLFSLFNELL